MSFNSIVINDKENHPLIEIFSVDVDKGKIYSKLPNNSSLSGFASLAAQAAPSLLTKAELAKGRIMEVIVNGNLVKAADGDGFRAFVRGADRKIIENARLYNADKLSKIVNITAIWQIASVVVAQKNLADINKKLDDLKDGIDRIQDFQQTERKSNVLMISNKLKEKITLLISSTDWKQEGVVSLSELNNYDAILEKIYLHLKVDLDTYGFKKTEHKEMFGTADYKNDLENKIKEVQEYLDFAYLSLNLRSMNTSIIDSLGGNGRLVEYRNNEMREEIERLNHVIKNIGQNIANEVEELKSVINDAQSFVKNNPLVLGVGVLVVPLSPIGLGLGLGLGAGTVMGFMAGRRRLTNPQIFWESKKTNLLEERKQEMLKMLNNSLTSSKQQADYSMKLVNTNLNQLIESEKPITLAFQKIDDTHILCLNTNEKFLVSV